MTFIDNNMLFLPPCKQSKDVSAYPDLHKSECQSLIKACSVVCFVARPDCFLFAANGNSAPFLLAEFRLLVCKDKYLCLFYPKSTMATFSPTHLGVLPFAQQCFNASGGTRRRRRGGFKEGKRGPGWRRLRAELEAELKDFI